MKKESSCISAVRGWQDKGWLIAFSYQLLALVEAKPRVYAAQRRFVPALALLVF